MDHVEPVWAERYRPKTIDQLILPDTLKKSLANLAKDDDMPHVIFRGGPGIGKTTAAMAIANERGVSCMKINGSEEGRSIDVLRTKIKDFASTASVFGDPDQRKILIIDEADHLGHAVQPALRGYMEEYSSNCIFILTCNYYNNIIQPLRSRCGTVDFSTGPDDRVPMIKSFFKSVKGILDDNGVSYDPKTVAQVIANAYPDFRHTLNTLQLYATEHGSEINTGVFAELSKTEYSTLILAMKEKRWVDVRNWVLSQSGADPVDLFNVMFDGAPKWFAEEEVPKAIVIMGEYQHKAQNAISQPINTLAFLTELMYQVKMK